MGPESVPVCPSPVWSAVVVPDASLEAVGATRPAAPVGLFTVTDTAVDVVWLPAASTATAVSEWGAVEVVRVSQLKL